MGAADGAGVGDGSGGSLDKDAVTCASDRAACQVRDRAAVAEHDAIADNESRRVAVLRDVQSGRNGPGNCPGIGDRRRLTARVDARIT